MAAVDATAVSQEELEAKAWEASPRATGRRTLMSATSSRRTTRRMRATSPSWLTPPTRPSTCGVSGRQLSVRGAQAARLRRGHPHPGGHRRFPAGYIDSPEVDNVIVGLQTDVPCKRAMMPNGGWRMVEQAIKEAGKEPDPEIKKIFTKYRKTHNDGVFASTPSRSR